MGLGGLRIAVVGAGIGGLAAACALARRGAEVCVYEAAGALGEVGAGLQLGPNSVAVLEALGLRDAAEVHASLPEAIELRDFAGRPVARLPLGAACVARYGRPYWQMHRADLAGVLAQAAVEAGAELRLGGRVVEALQVPGGAVLRLEEGAEARADLVVGADGIRSGIRAAGFGGEEARFTGHVAWRGLVPAERLPPGLFPKAACVTMGPGRHVVTYPLRGGALWNFVAVEERAGWTAEGWMVPDDPAALRRAFAGAGPAVAALLEAVETTYLWGLFDHPVLPAWVRGRVALLGDACHPMLPFLAQGAAMALEDAWVLGACLAAAQEPEQGLMAYEDRRKPRATRVQRAAARNGRVYHLASPLLRGAVHAALRGVSALAPGALLGRFDWLYGANVVGMDPGD